MSLRKVSADWSITGNEDIDESDNFIGNIDAKPLIIKTNNLERVRVLSTGEVGIGISIPGELLHLEQDMAGSPVAIRLRNASTTGSGSDACIDIRVASPSAGDPHIRMTVQGVPTNWSFGIDNSDNDSFKITEALGLASNARIKIEKGGKVFLNRNVEIGPAALTEVQFQLLSKPSQSANIMQVGEDAGDIDGFFVMDEAGNIGIGASINPIAKLHVDGSFFVTGNIGFFGISPVAQSPAYTPTNVTTDRSYDANITTVNELADVLGTLISDLQTYGLLQ